MQDFTNSKEFALSMDEADELKGFRDQFIFPTFQGGQALYFTGNSLGLQPEKAKEIILEEMDDWALYGVEGHTMSRRPWVKYHEFFTGALAEIVGAKSTEVVAMNGLTTNLHLLMASFYRPQGKRTKILCEGKAFPSDQYALQSQLRFHGLDASHLIEIKPNEDDELLNVDLIYKTIEAHNDEIAVLMMGGVNYYTGQVLPMKEITAFARERGIVVGWDLAHGAGNVSLELHEWGVDFAAWCGYKYLNSGPGGVSGVFIHERHHGKKDIPRFEGWWGHDKASRFTMPETFNPIPTAEAWQLSNAPVLSMAPLLASLELFQKAGMSALRKKALHLSNYLRFVIHEAFTAAGREYKILTPSADDARGAQVSLVVPEVGKEVFDFLSKNNVIADWREPDVIRLAPVPMYNSYMDVFEFGQLLERGLRVGSM